MSYALGSEGVTEAKTPRLLDQVRARLRLKYYGIRTEQAYVGWVRRFVLANGKRDPRETGVAGVEALLRRFAKSGSPYT